MDDLRQIDLLIRSGQAKLAREKLQHVLDDKLPRADLALAANLAWRCNLPHVGIQLLNKIVRPANRPVEPATPLEKAEYAVSLIKLGALDEGLSLLDTIHGEGLSQTWLYRAFAHINRWEYRQAIPLLESYLEKTSDAYAKIVGEINLTQALLFERRLDEAKACIENLLQKTTAPEFSLARATLFEFQAVRFILLGDWQNAEPILDKAATTLSQNGGTPSFLVLKWKTILQYLKSGGQGDSARALADLRIQALKLSSWETVRECDRFESKTNLDVALHLKLFFGTPFRSYRAQIVHDFPQIIDLPSHYPYRMGAGELSCEIDLSTGDVLKKGRSIKIEKLLLKVLVVLSSDFYRPFRIASLHHALHPGDFFNPHSSPARVQRAVQRLRKYFQENKVPLQITQQDGFYRLEAGAGAVILHVPQALSVLEGVSPELFLLQRKYKESAFSLREAAKVLQISSRTANRIVQRAEETGELLRLGKGKSTKYHFFKKTA